MMKKLLEASRHSGTISAVRYNGERQAAPVSVHYDDDLVSGGPRELLAKDPPLVPRHIRVHRPSLIGGLLVG